MSATQNLEEAANVASEFIYSIDNLPNEVNFILQELKHKDARTQELQQEIDKDTAKYIRHSLKASSSSPSIPSSPSSRTPSPKLIALPAKIQASYAEIHLLSTEKCALAQTLIDLITRTRAKLDTDLAKVRVLQGDLDYSASLASSASFVGTDSFTTLGRTQQITESLRSALAAPALADIKNATAVSSAASPAGSATGGPAYKKRRVATGSIKLTPAGSPAKHRSASPTTAPSTTHTRVASRLSRQSTKQEETEIDEGDEDAEGEEGDAEDERLYCTCQSQSYGDMIACDNEGCPYEWFHVSCVNLKGPAPDKWYCNFCIKKLGGVPSMTGRKGRKK